MTSCLRTKQSKKYLKSGFTLVEVLIAVAITGILAAVAVPSFMGYIIDSRRAEAILVLSRMHKDQAVLRDTKGSYMMSLDMLWGQSAPADSPRFVYGFHQQTGDNPTCIVPSNTEECHSTYGESDPSKLHGVGSKDIDTVFNTISILSEDPFLYAKNTIKSTYNPRSGPPLPSDFLLGMIPNGYMAVGVGNLDGDTFLEKVMLTETGAVGIICDDKKDQKLQNSFTTAGIAASIDCFLQ